MSGRGIQNAPRTSGMLKALSFLDCFRRMIAIVRMTQRIANRIQKVVSPAGYLGASIIIFGCGSKAVTVAVAVAVVVTVVGSDKVTVVVRTTVFVTTRAVLFWISGASSGSTNIFGEYSVSSWE